MPCNLKMTGCGVKRIEIWDGGGGVVACLWGAFDLLVFEVNWGSFGALV